MLEETWKPFKLPGHDDVQFYASSWGRIKSDPYTITVRAGKGFATKTLCVKPTYGHFNRDRTNFKFRHKTYKVHRVVCTAFNGPPPNENSIVLHLDENFKNNKPDNLEWGTHSANSLAPKIHKWHMTKPRNKNGTFIKGVKKDLIAA